MASHTGDRSLMTGTCARDRPNPTMYSTMMLGMARKPSTYMIAIARSGRPAGPGSSRMTATTRPTTSTSSWAPTATSMFTQNATVTSRQDSWMNSHRRKVRDTAPSLAVANRTRAATRRTARA